jgi:hypothetical protein
MHAARCNAPPITTALRPALPGKTPARVRDAQAAGGPRKGNLEPGFARRELGGDRDCGGMRVRSGTRKEDPGLPSLPEEGLVSSHLALPSRLPSQGGCIIYVCDPCRPSLDEAAGAEKYHPNRQTLARAGSFARRRSPPEGSCSPAIRSAACLAWRISGARMHIQARCVLSVCMYLCREVVGTCGGLFRAPRPCHPRPARCPGVARKAASCTGCRSRRERQEMADCRSRNVLCAAAVHTWYRLHTW